MSDARRADELTVLAKQCRNMADSATNETAKRTLTDMADNYEAALADLLDQRPPSGVPEAP